MSKELTAAGKWRQERHLRDVDELVSRMVSGVDVEDMTNTQFIVKLMNYSDHGALIQSFVIEAIRLYSQQIAALPEPKDDPESFISPKLWHQIAKDVIAKIEEKYEHKPRGESGDVSSTGDTATKTD